MLCRLVSATLVWGLALSGIGMAAPEQPDLSPLRDWMARQKNVRSLSADFVQSRALRTLRSPVTIPGRFWSILPDFFRWELGDPAKTIVIGTPDGITTIHPLKKRAERRPLPKEGDPAEAGPLGMVRLPGGGSFEQFEKRVRVLAFETEGTRAHLEMLPHEAARALSVIKLDFDTVSGHWISLEIVTREGSSIRNVFDNVRINPPLDKSLFEYNLAGFRVNDEIN
jgi:outer membrane lipoprotein-sorting protein